MIPHEMGKIDPGPVPLLVGLVWKCLQSSLLLLALCSVIASSSAAEIGRIISNDIGNHLPSSRSSCPGNTSCVYDHECETRCPDEFFNFGKTACVGFTSLEKCVNVAGGHLLELYPSNAPLLTILSNEIAKNRAVLTNAIKVGSSVDFLVKTMEDPSDPFPYSPKCLSVNGGDGPLEPTLRPCAPGSDPEESVLCQIGAFDTPCDAAGTKCCFKTRQRQAKMRPRKQSPGNECSRCREYWGNDHFEELRNEYNFACDGSGSSLLRLVSNQAPVTSSKAAELMMNSVGPCNEPSKGIKCGLVAVDSRSISSAVEMSLKSIQHNSGYPWPTSECIFLASHFSLQPPSAGDGSILAKCEDAKCSTVVASKEDAGYTCSHFVVQVTCLVPSQDNTDAPRVGGNMLLDQNTDAADNAEPSAVTADGSLVINGQGEAEQEAGKTGGVLDLLGDASTPAITGHHGSEVHYPQDTQIKTYQPGAYMPTCGVRSPGGRFARQLDPNNLQNAGDNAEPSLEDEQDSEDDMQPTVGDDRHGLKPSKSSKKKKSKKTKKKGKKSYKQAEEMYSKTASTSVGYMEFPWQTAVLLCDGSGSSLIGRFLCSGSLVWVDSLYVYVVVPSSCVRTLTGEQLKRTIVVTGLFDLDRVKDTFQKPMAFGLHAMHAHPAWHQENIAVLIAYKAVAFSLGFTKIDSTTALYSSYTTSTTTYKTHTGDSDECESYEEGGHKYKRCAAGKKTRRHAVENSAAIPFPAVCLPPAARRYSPNSMWRKCLILGWTLGPNNAKKILRQGAVKLVNPKYCVPAKNKKRKKYYKDEYYDEYEHHLCAKYSKGATVCIDDPGAMLICQPKMTYFSSKDEYRRRRNVNDTDGSSLSGEQMVQDDHYEDDDEEQWDDFQEADLPENLPQQHFSQDAIFPVNGLHAMQMPLYRRAPMLPPWLSFQGRVRPWFPIPTNHQHHQGDNGLNQRRTRSPEPLEVTTPHLVTRAEEENSDLFGAKAPTEEQDEDFVMTEEESEEETDNLIIKGEASDELDSSSGEIERRQIGPFMMSSPGAGKFGLIDDDLSMGGVVPSNGGFGPSLGFPRQGDLAGLGNPQGSMFQGLGSGSVAGFSPGAVPPFDPSFFSNTQPARQGLFQQQLDPAMLPPGISGMAGRGGSMMTDMNGQVGQGSWNPMMNGNNPHLNQLPDSGPNPFGGLSEGQLLQETALLEQLLGEEQGRSAFGSNGYKKSKKKKIKKYKPYTGDAKLDPGSYYIVGVRARPTTNKGYRCSKTTGVPFTSLSENMGFVHGVIQIGRQVVNPKLRDLGALRPWLQARP